MVSTAVPTVKYYRCQGTKETPPREIQIPTLWLKHLELEFGAHILPTSTTIRHRRARSRFGWKGVNFDLKRVQITPDTM